ncbi:MAG: ComF family protein [bacterium]
MTRIFNIFTSFLDAAFNFIYPPFCIVCESRQQSGAVLVCEVCWEKLPRLEPQVGDAAISGVSRSLSVWEYGDGMQRIIHEFKFFGKKSLGPFLALEMAGHAKKDRDFSHADLIVPVPLHPTKLRERGFNQSVILSEHVARILHIPVQPNVLIRKRYTKPQSTLNSIQREKNMRNAFDVQNVQLIKYKSIILVDDVMTTGSTVKACAECLLGGGAHCILTLTAAKTVK